MLAQEKKIRGFNILELLVVIVIVGILSAAAYPNFSDWRSERAARAATVKIKNLIQGINAQVQRGLYAYVQVLVENTKDNFEKVSFCTHLRKKCPFAHFCILLRAPTCISYVLEALETPRALFQKCVQNAQREGNQRGTKKTCKKMQNFVKI